MYSEVRKFGHSSILSIYNIQYISQYVFRMFRMFLEYTLYFYDSLRTVSESTCAVWEFSYVIFYYLAYFARQHLGSQIMQINLLTQKSLNFG